MYMKPFILLSYYIEILKLLVHTLNDSILLRGSQTSFVFVARLQICYPLSKLCMGRSFSWIGISDHREARTYRKGHFFTSFPLPFTMVHRKPSCQIPVCKTEK